MGDEGHLLLVTIFDVDIVIPPTNVELGEVVSVFQLIYEVRDERKEVGVVGGVFVEVSIILARVEFAILPFDKEEWRHLGGVGRADLSCSQVFFKEVLGCLLFITGKWINFVHLRYEGLIQVEIGRAHV